jgi:hypothetical protein
MLFPLFYSQFDMSKLCTYQIIMQPHLHVTCVNFDVLLCSSSVQLEQGTVTSLLEENGTVKGVQYKTKSGEELKAYAPLTIVCDGCFSNLRRALCSPKVHTLYTIPAIYLLLNFVPCGC